MCDIMCIMSVKYLKKPNLLDGYSIKCVDQL